MTTPEDEASTVLDPMPNEVSLESDTLLLIGKVGPNISQPEISSLAFDGNVTNATNDQRPTGALLQIPITVQVVLGSSMMALSKVMALGPGSLISLDQQLSDPVLMLLNGKEFARGTIVVTDETSGQLGISLTEITSHSPSFRKNG